MKTIYSTTKPGWHDTTAIAAGKLAQQKVNPSTASAGLVATPTSTKYRACDSKLRILQKILAISQTTTAITNGLVTDLVSHWKLNDLNYQDSVGANHLTANEVPTLGVGKFYAQAVKLTSFVDGGNVGNPYLLRAASDDFQAVTDFTYAGWFTAEHVLMPGWFLTKASEYSIGTSGTIYSAGTTLGTEYYGSALAAPSLNAWHFFIFSYDLSEKSFYLGFDDQTNKVEGVLTDWPGGDVDVGAGALQIGRMQTGRFQSISYWKRLLTATEKLYLWNNGAGRAYPF